jgi:hypothetical protein
MVRLAPFMDNNTLLVLSILRNFTGGESMA